MRNFDLLCKQWDFRKIWLNQHLVMHKYKYNALSLKHIVKSFTPSQPGANLRLTVQARPKLW